MSIGEYYHMSNYRVNNLIFPNSNGKGFNHISTNFANKQFYDSYNLTSQVWDKSHLAWIIERYEDED